MKGDTERETKEKEANKSDGLKHRSGWLENVKKLQKLCRIHNIICQFSPATFKFRGTMTFSTVCFSLLAVANANNWLQLGNKFRLCHFTVSQKSVNRSKGANDSLENYCGCKRWRKKPLLQHFSFYRDPIGNRWNSFTYLLPDSAVDICCGREFHISQTKNENERLTARARLFVLCERSVQKYPLWVG